MEENIGIDLSVIVPVYNTPTEFVAECLESIHTSINDLSYEILVVDDGSDNAELKNFLQNYSGKNTQVLCKENGGVSSARNLGMRFAKGRVILCLDSDDKLLPEINTAIQFLEENKDYDVVYSDVQSFGDNNSKAVKGDFSKFKLLYIGHITSISNLFRRELLAKIDYFNENLDYAEDWDFWARAASAGFKFKYLPEPYFLYRRIHNGNSLSQKNFDKREEIKTFIKSQFDPHKEITLEEINTYVLNNFRNSKKQFIKLFILLYLPFIYKILVKTGVYKNNIIVD